MTDKRYLRLTLASAPPHRGTHTHTLARMHTHHRKEFLSLKTPIKTAGFFGFALFVTKYDMAPLVNIQKDFIYTNILLLEAF